MIRFLMDLEEAFCRVPIKYYSNTVRHLGRNNFIEQGIERPYTSELYHQWRVIMNAKPELYKNLILQTEIGKVLDGSVFPDIVLHHGQYRLYPHRAWRSIYENMNAVAIEIKIATYDNHDIEKLFKYLSELNYLNAVYIIPEISTQNLCSKIHDHLHTYTDNSEQLCKLYFLTKKTGLISYLSLFQLGQHIFNTNNL